MSTTRERIKVGSYKYSEDAKWKFCPRCFKRLFEVLDGKGFIIEIKCRSCKNVVMIREL